MSGQTLVPPASASSRADIESFDPFEDSAQMRLLRDAKPRTIAAMIVTGLLAVVLSAIIGNRFGTLADFQPIDDAQRLMQVGDPPPSLPSFPLTRDVISWYLIVMSAATLAIVRLQWRWITAIVPHLAEAGALHWRGSMGGARRWRELLVGSAHADDAPKDFLDAALNRARRVITATGRYWWVIFIVAAAVAVGYINGEVDGSFGALAPPHLSAGGEQKWLDEAISSWWAGPDNLYGLFVYFVISALMFSAIAAQNAVGFAAIYLFVVMRRTFEFRCDWENRDGRYGWDPLAALYRITLLALVLHIAAITSVMWVMGWGRYAYMTILIVIPVIAVPLYLIVPAIIFARFGKREKKRRIAELTAERTAELGGSEEIALLRALRDEIEYVRKAKINPLRPSRREIPASVATILIPATLTAVQVIAAINS
jgi:hypothetical protein